MSKKPENKPELSLVYPSMLEAIARVRRYGIDKHGSSEDWRSTDSIKHFDAMLRHIFAYLDGEEVDQASGLSHLAHVAANVMFEIERRKHVPLIGGVEYPYKTITEQCSRCKANDDYPIVGVHACTNGCGNFIEPLKPRENNLQDNH
jgi:hypothetical protein